MKTVEWAWNSDPDTPDEKLVLIAMNVRDTSRRTRIRTVRSDAGSAS